MHKETLHAGHPWIVANRRKCAVAALVPLLLVALGSPAEVSCIGLGLSCAWTAESIFRTGGLPTSRVAWAQKMRLAWMLIGGMLALTVALGFAVGTRTSLPFPIMAFVSAMPAAGMVPWLTLRVPPRYGPIVFGAMIVFLSKLAGCVAARVVYGPSFQELGYVAGDWNKAPLMISVTWGLSTSVSLWMIWSDSRRMSRP